MPEKLTINLPDEPPRAIVLERSMVRVGQDPSCEVQILHPEVPPYAANLDYRDGAYFLQNLNNYPLYLGQVTVPPSAWASWTPGDALYLTRSVSLILETQLDEALNKRGRRGKKVDPTISRVTGDAPEEEAEAGQGSKKAYQLGTTIACLLLAAYLLVTDTSGEGELDTQETFPQLVEDFNAQAGDEFDRSEHITLRYLQEAWTWERRARTREDITRAQRAYRLLLNHPPIRSAPPGSSIEGRIKAFASARLERLQSR